jgi:nickel-dependent lactate racemase
VLNRLAVEADLLISKGFIEPHFFAGFSGGRKSVMPGVASAITVLANHCAQFIASPKARAGILDGNPIHIDMLYAAKAVNLAFILNVALMPKRGLSRPLPAIWRPLTYKAANSSLS